MQLRKIKPDEQKIRLALLKDLQAKVKHAHIQVLGKHLGALRAAPAKEAEKTEDGPSDADGFATGDVPSIVHKDAELEAGPNADGEGDDPNDYSEESEEGETKPGKPSLADMIRKLSSGKK